LTRLRLANEGPILLRQSLLEKGGLTNERKMEPDAFLKECALPYL
jgi:F-type H+-transporting ATPase subunit alpha